MKEKPKEEFYVYTLSTHEKPGYCHWADGLTMYIKKDGVQLKLNSEEIQKLVKALPRTMGGSY